MSNTAKDYRGTLNLPQTDFAMRANLPKREPEWVQRWLDKDIYGQQRKARKDAEKFILHLGPPYANGAMHLGHVVTYTLKDFVVRSKSMAGFDTPYIPGWDCHGLPIEWKVETELREKGKSKTDFSTKQLRDMCRDYANKWITVQKADWQRMGCIGDWDNPYLTMNFANEAEEYRQLCKLLQNGYLYRGHKPVQWSPVEETALAEAEIEYDENHESTAIYVKYPIIGCDNEFVVIWTTTPWTIPASKAVSFGEKIEYVLVEGTEIFEKATAQKGEKYWVATELKADFAKMCGLTEFKEHTTQTGGFADTKIQHPYLGTELPMLAGEHVTTEAGTGFVHTAPAHGIDDYAVGTKAGLDAECHVDGAGNYDETVAPLPKTGVELTGKNVLDKKTASAIVDELTAQGNLLRWYKLKHSYPISWRSKKPLITRTTPQWFVRMDGDTSLRSNALTAIDTVQWIPAYGRNRIYSMIEGRPDWCISRQRKWGVPIAVCLNKKTGEYIQDPAVLEHVANLMEKEGVDAWDSRIEENRIAELFPAGWLEANDLTVDDVVPERDILDVWFDSGTTHAHVIRKRAAELGIEDRVKNNQPLSDMYFEGSDQHRGWFHSSLLTSVANYGHAPYKTVLTNNFTVDGEGRKMSKSIGNVIAPEEMCKKYGMDVTRLWVAATDYTSDIPISDTIMAGVVDGYRKLRNTFKYLLGNLSDFDIEKDAVTYDKMPELEQYVLHRLHTVATEAKGYYDAYQFHKVYRAFYDFVVQDLSNLYFDVRKDALYCDAQNAVRRRACQTVLHHLLNVLCTYFSPVLVFTTDEVWREYYGDDECVHLAEFHPVQDEWQRDEAFSSAWEEVLSERDKLNQFIEVERAAGKVKSNAEVIVNTHAKVNKAWLLEAMQTYGIIQNANQPAGVAYSDQIHKCPRCWTYHEELTAEGVCDRCDEALKLDGKQGVPADEKAA